MIPTLIVPTLVHYDLLQNMLDSIDVEVDHVVVIDNGGKLEGIKFDNCKKLSVISLPTNIGVAGAWNLGIKVTPYSKWWLISNDDVLWLPGALSRMASYVTEGAIIADWNPLSAFSGFIIDEVTISKIGLFDEHYFPGIGEELNYWRRATMNGIDGIQASNVFELQGHIGMTRKYLDEQYPGTGARMMENINEATIQAGRVVGWSLDKRREYPF